MDAARSPATVAVTDLAAAAEHLRARAEEQPEAALVLHQVLRMAGRLPVPEALDVESMAYSMLLGGAGFARWLAARGPRPAPPPATCDPVLVRRTGDVLRITLDWPERRNAHGAQLRDALVAAVDIAVRDETARQVILDGNGPCFSFGGDLDEFGTTWDLAAAHLIRTRAGVAPRLHALGGRLTARIRGGQKVAAGPEVWRDGAEHREEFWASAGERKPFMARSRRRAGWWEFCARLFRYVDCRCPTEHISSRWATPQLRSLSVTSARGTRHCFFISLAMNRLAALAWRLLWTRTSSTLPSWSTARHSYRRSPLIFTNTSSRCHLSPARGFRRRSPAAYAGPNLAHHCRIVP
jgi:hypothetical protein